MSRLVLPLGSVRAADRSRVGGKAALLGEMLGRGFPVPPGLCLTVEAYREHLASCGFRGPAEGFRGDDPARVAAEAREAILRAPVPPGVAAAVREALPLVPGPVAVRSSALDEDSAEASFAGQHDSFLDVEGEEAVLSALRRCWASLWTERALAYRARHGGNAMRAAIGCVVQAMVRAEFAGVAFSADPVTGARDRVVVNAVAGLAEGLVSGRRSADLCVLGKADGRVLALRTADPRVLDPERQPWLSDLRRLVEELEAALGAPQDVEWAVAAGRVHLVQARPITALPPEPIPLAEATPPLLVYPERIREMVPSALTPLTGDLAQRVVLPAVTEAMARHGLVPPALVAEAPALGRLERGRVYLDLDVFRRVLLPGLDVLALLDLLEHGRRPPLRALRPRQLLDLLRAAPRLARLLPMLLRLDVLGRQAETAMDALFAPLEKEDFTTWTWERLLGLLRLEAAGGLRAALVGLSPANPLARGAATPFHSAVEWMVRHWAGGTRETAGALVSGLAGLVEVECAEALWDLAQQAREAPAVARALEADPAGVLEALSDVPEAAAWRAAFRAFLDRFGHRAIEEVEMARPRWRERPAYPLSVIAGYLRCPGERSPRVVEARRRAEREAAETAVGARLRFRPLRRLVFRLALRVAQAAGPAGENTKFHIVRLLTLWRQAALEMGRRLMAEDRLERAEDVFFLRLEELARPKGDFRDRVAARSADLRRWQREDPPRLIDAEGRAVLEGMREAQAPALETDTLSGIGSSAGRARGRVRVVRDPSGGVELEPGEVLVAPYTDPAWTPLFLTACAVVVETGSLLSHASIVARELGVPCVVGVAGATRLLRDGVEVEVDASRGVVRRLAARRDPPTPGGST